MKIVMITENDPAGMGIAFTKAFNRCTEHQCRLVTTATRYNFNFEKDLHIPDLDREGLDEVAHLLMEADILHFHILADENMELGPLRVKDFIRGKALLHHHHGHPDFRAYPETYRKKYRRSRRKVLVSTPDLLKLVPEATWQPNPVPIDDPLYLPEAAPENGSVIIGQSATRKDLKNTEELTAVVHDIQRKIVSPKVELQVIERTEHRECLRRKNRCHIIFDHMQGYYGVSSLESLSQGKPVIAGLDEWNIRCIRTFTCTDKLPWLISRTPDELDSTLTNLIRNPEPRHRIGTTSRRFMEACWSEPQVLNALVRFYETL
jgi:hypothetical protein